VDEPLNTVLAKNSTALVEPFLIEVNHAESGNGVRGAKSVDEPLSTVTQKRAHGLIEPFILDVNHGADPTPRGTNGRRAHSIDKPLPTVTTEPSKALIEPFVVKYYGTGVARPMDEPLDTVTGNDRFGLVDPFLIQYNGKSESHPVDEPVNTIPTRDRFGLVTTEHGTFKLDIRFRMLTNKELARAQGLPDTYIVKGKKAEITKQIGNMVPVNLAKAVIAAQLSVRQGNE
jgi:DNA (cytosine-5)-methyltransferase 1